MRNLTMSTEWGFCHFHYLQLSFHHPLYAGTWPFLGFSLFFFFFRPFIMLVSWMYHVHSIKFPFHIVIGAPKISIPNVLRINLWSVWWCWFIQYFFPKTRKPYVFWIPFCDQSEMTVMHLFKHVWKTVWLYLIMYVRLKWVGSDKLLESVLRLMDIRVIDNVC